MLGIHDYPVFVTTALLLNVTPGPDTMYILGRSVAEGRRSGVASALGISAGCLGHTVAAALGLSALLATSAWAFTAVKYAGAAYLFFLGAKALLGPAAAVEAPQLAGGAFRQGVITNLLNPKVALFFLALLPQFVDKNASSPALSFLALGLTFIATGTAWCVGLALLAARVSDRIRASRRFSAWLRRTSGALFLGLGLKLATSERP